MKIALPCASLLAVIACLLAGCVMSSEPDPQPAAPSPQAKASASSGVHTDGISTSPSLGCDDPATCQR
ncbi:MAG TPA: hypothetical protein VMI75_29300 [Polyangiaceae bacterium]|nr:hypothetical protein [Polyangiaceae bacterium]